MKERIINAIVRWIERKGLDLRAAQNRINRLNVRHGLSSAILSTDDEPGQPNDRLLAIAEATVRTCRTVTLPDYSDRLRPVGIDYFHRWPGEHYRVLAALCG